MAASLPGDPAGPGDDDRGAESDGSWDTEGEHLALAEIADRYLDENERLEVYASTEGWNYTWLDNKRIQQAARKGRQLIDRQSSGAPSVPDPPRGSSRPLRRDRQGGRLTIEQLKLVSRCANCGERGHWKAECNNPIQAPL